MLLAKEPTLISFGGGEFDVFRQNKNTTTEFRVELRPGAIWHTIRPTLGFMMTLQGSTYLYGGFGFDWLIKRFYLSPNFAAGWYSKGCGKNLGYPLEFRSGIEIGVELPQQSRLGIHFYHLSNASLSKKNPGSESFVIFYSHPVYF